jgi:GNAT superfamily N-acetyltransferase
MHELVRYHPDRKEQIAGLQRHLWSADVRLNRAYFAWKYEENPFIKAPVLQLALSAGRVVGMRGMFGSCWEVGSPARRVLVPCADDFVIEPAHRNHGIGGAIMRAAVEDGALSDFEYAFSLSAGPVTRAASLVAGWRAVESMGPARRTSASAAFIDRMAARLRTAPMLWRCADPLVRAHHRGVGGLFRSLDRRGRTGGGRSSAAVRVEAAPPVDAIADLVARLGHDGRLRHVRDEAYLRWRYRDPLHEYRFLVQGNDRLDGYLVLQAHRTEPERGIRIVDWEATTPGVRIALLHAALEWGRFPSVIVWTATLPSETEGPLAALGFVPTRSGSKLRAVATTMIRPVGRAAGGTDPILEGRRLLDLASWDMRMVYSMAG